MWLELPTFFFYLNFVCALTFPGFCVIIPSIAARLLWMWSFSMCFYIKEKEKKSYSSKQYSNLPYRDPSDTVSGDEWCECVFAWEGDLKCACDRVCLRVWEFIYQQVLRTYVCSNDYAAMYNLVCYLNSTSTGSSLCVCTMPWVQQLQTYSILSQTYLQV